MLHSKVLKDPPFYPIQSKITTLNVKTHENIKNYFLGGDPTMWVLTVFEKDTFHLFEFETKEEALALQSKTEYPSVITYTNLTLVA